MPGAAPTFPPDAPTLADGRYILVARIGEGGIAAVYRGYDRKLRVWRAVKLLMPEFSGRKSMCQRLESEALTMAQLEHPNLVRVYDVGYAGAVPFLVMELVNGGTLQHWTDRHGPMPPVLASETVQQVLRGLVAVHETGVVHRDVKPRNVLVAPNGTCKLTDFGIARSEAERTGRGPKMLGTMGYSAPEQLEDPASVDGRADLYSVGALLWHLCTARDVMQTLYRAEDDYSLLTGVHEALHTVIFGCVARDREQRFERADQVIAALDDAIAELPRNPRSTPELVVDVSMLEQLLKGADFPELVQVIEEQRKRPASPAPAVQGSAQESPRMATPKNKPLPYVMQTVDPEARRRAFLGKPAVEEDTLPEWIDQGASPPAARPQAPSRPPTPVPAPAPAPVPASKARVEKPVEREEKEEPYAPIAPDLVEEDLWSGRDIERMASANPAPRRKDAPSSLPPKEEPPRSVPPKAEPAPVDSARISMSKLFSATPPPGGATEAQPEATSSASTRAPPAGAAAPPSGPVTIGVQGPPPVADPQSEPEERSLAMWLLAVPLVALIVLGTLFALGATVFAGNGMLALSDAAVATEASRNHLYRVLNDEREVVNDLALLGADRNELERLYVDYMQERDPARRLAAARVFVARADQESPRINENEGQNEVAHRLRLLRNALRDYDQGLADWHTATDSQAGRLVIAMGLGTPAP